MSEQDCLFCKILAGTAAADVVYQDNRCVAVRDIDPQAPTHVLVIPREHLDSLDDATQRDESLLGHLLRVSARVANDHGLSEWRLSHSHQHGQRRRPVSLSPARACARRTRDDLASRVDSVSIRLSGSYPFDSKEKTRAVRRRAFLI